MPTLHDILSLPEEVTKSAFVVRLAEAVTRPDSLMGTYAITPNIHHALDHGLTLISTEARLQARARRARNDPDRVSARTYCWRR